MPCNPQDDEELVRKSHLMGMRPLILISYRHPVNFYRWETENLQIQMEAAPLRTSGGPNCPCWWWWAEMGSLEAL